MRFKEFISEKWTKKYKKSINCSNPKGFSQKAHCAGRKARQAGKHTKSNSVNETELKLEQRKIELSPGDMSDRADRFVSRANLPKHTLPPYKFDYYALDNYTKRMVDRLMYYDMQPPAEIKNKIHNYANLTKQQFARSDEIARQQQAEYEKSRLGRAAAAAKNAPVQPTKAASTLSKIPKVGAALAAGTGLAAAAYDKLDIDKVKDFFGFEKEQDPDVKEGYSAGAAGGSGLNEFFDTGGGGDDDDELKRQIIEMYFEDGLRETEIARITGLSEVAVNNIIDQYERGDFTIDEGTVTPIKSYLVAAQLPNSSDSKVVFKDSRNGKIIAVVSGAENNLHFDMNGKHYLSSNNNIYLLPNTVEQPKKVKRTDINPDNKVTNIFPSKKDLIAHIKKYGLDKINAEVIQKNISLTDFLQQFTGKPLMSVKNALDLGYIKDLGNGKFVFDGALSEGQIYSTGGGAGQSYRKFTPKSKEINEYGEIEGQRKIVFSKENPPDLYYLYQQFIQRMLNPENTVDPYEWIEKVNNHYGLNYTWRDYQKRGQSDHTNNWQRVINKYIVNKR